MPKIQVNDIAMYYETHGKGEPLVLIGGFSVDHTTWASVIDKFSDHYQVVLFDNRGAGQTDVPEGHYSVLQMAEDIAALCSALNINQAHFVGSSMGGHILQTLAYRYPQLVKSAVISNSAMTTQCCFHFYVTAQLELLKADAPLVSLIKASCSWLFSYSFLSRPSMIDNLIQFTLQNPFPFTLTGYEGQYAALNSFDSREWVDKIQVPTLVLSADQDLIFRESFTKQLAERIPNARYFCFAGCGHLPHIEYPDKFAEIVKEFHSK